MTTLSKRATSRQKMAMRIIAGAVRNVAHAHNNPDLVQLADSIAKRAVGTLTAAMPEVLVPSPPPTVVASTKPTSHFQPDGLGITGEGLIW